MSNKIVSNCAVVTGCLFMFVLLIIFIAFSFSFLSIYTYILDGENTNIPIDAPVDLPNTPVTPVTPEPKPRPHIFPLIKPKPKP